MPTHAALSSRELRRQGTEVGFQGGIMNRVPVGASNLGRMTPGFEALRIVSNVFHGRATHPTYILYSRTSPMPTYDRCTLRHSISVRQMTCPASHLPVNSNEIQGNR